MYTEQIIKATKCDPKDAPRIEEIMRQHIFRSTLDWQTARQFNNGAKKAKKFLDFERSPEGIEMAKRVEDEMLNPENIGSLPGFFGKNNQSWKNSLNTCQS